MAMPKKILIVDDEPFIRALLEQTLEDFEDEGVELLAAGDGQEAWDMAQEERPNLVILDVMMPFMSGYEVCERIKSEPALKDTYVILLTAKGQQVDRQRGEQVNADEYVTKPFDPDYLVERTQAVLDISL
jgi:two-component system alkaline phosphatase synthesis response regulator PhoP